MADINSEININIDTSSALNNIKALQRQISAFHTELTRGGAQANLVSSQMTQNLLNTVNATGKFNASIKTVKTTTESFTNSLEKNKLSFGEYFRYAGASSKSFGKMFKQEFETINKVARERVKDLQTQYIQLGRDANGAMRSIAVRPLTLDMDALATKTAVAAQKQQLLNQLLKQGSTNLLNFGKNTQWAGRQLMVGFTIPLGIMGSAAAKTFMKMEEQAIKFKRVYGDSFTPSKETDMMLEQIKELASEFTKYGVAITDTMDIAAKAAATGKMGADLTAQVAESTRLAVLGGVEQNQALETTISLTNAFGTASDELRGKINFLNAVENQTVTSIEDLTTAIPKAGPVIQQLGGDVEDLAFFLTAMREGGINASESANALKSGLAAMINPTGKAADMLKGFGINLKGIVETNKGDVKGTVVEFAKALDTLDPLDRARAIEQLFGKFQFARISTLFKNVIAEGSQANRVLQLTSQSSTELAMLANKELGRIEDSPMYKFQKAIADFQAQLAPVGEQFLKAVTPVIEFGTKILESFNKMDEGVKLAIVNITGIVAGLGPIFLMTFGLIANGVANVIKGFAFIKNVFNRASTASTVLGETTNYMTQEQLEAAAVAASLEQSHNRLTQAFSSERGAIDALTAAYQRATVAQKAFRGPVIPGGPMPKPKGFAKGGMINGPGSGTSDSILAMLSNGEAVIPAKSVSKNKDLIENLISGNVPKFAKGGILGGMLNRSRVATRLPGQTLLQMLLGGDTKYKSAFETQSGVDFLRNRGTSTETRDPVGEATRRRMEADAFGIPFGNGSKGRPTYGSVATTGMMSRILNRLLGGKMMGRQYNSITNPMSEDLDLYGDVSLIGKRSIGERSSIFTGGDMLRSYRQIPAFVKNGNSRGSMYGSGNPFESLTNSLSNPFGKAYKSGSGFTQNSRQEFIETHTPGGFDLSEIQQIISKNPELVPMIRSALKSQGLNIPVRGQRSGIMQKIFGYAKGGMIMGPGSGTSDSIPAMVSNGEFIVNAKRTKQYLPLLQEIAKGKVPGFASPDGGTQIGGGLGKGFKNATVFMPESMNTLMGSDTGQGARRADVLKYMKQSGGAAMSPLIAVMAKEMGLSLRNTENKAQFIAVAERMSNSMIQSISSSTQEFVKDADFESMVVPALKKSVDKIQIAGKEVSEALSNSINRVYTVGQVGTQSGSSGALGRTPISPVSYIRQRRTAQDLAIDMNPGMFSRDVVPSKSKGSKNLFRTMNPATGSKEVGTAAHITKSLTMPVNNIIKEVSAYVKDVSQRIVSATSKSITDGTTQGFNAATKRKSPPQEAINAGEDYGNALNSGAKSKTDDATQAGKDLAQAQINGTRSVPTTRSGKRVTTQGIVDPTIITQSGGRRKGRRVRTQGPILPTDTGYIDAPPITRDGPMQGPRRSPEMVKEIVKKRMGGSAYRATQAKRKITPGKASGAGFVASTALAMGAGAVGGPAGDVMGTAAGALSVLSMFGGALSKIIPVLVRFAGPIGLAISAVTLLVGVVELATRAERERVQQAKDMADATKVTTEKMQGLGNFFGATVKDRGFFQRPSGAVDSKGESIQQSVISELKKTDSFKKDFKSTVDAVRNGSAEEAKIVLQNLQVALASDFAPDQVSMIVEAIKQEAKKTDVKLDFSALDFSTKKGAASALSTIESSVQASARGSISGVTGLKTGANQQSINTAINRGEETSAYFTEEEKAKIETYSNTVQTSINTLNAAFVDGKISQDQYRESLNRVYANLNSLTPVQQAMAFKQLSKSMIDAKDIKIVDSLSDQKTKFDVLTASVVNYGEALAIAAEIAQLENAGPNAASAERYIKLQKKLAGLVAKAKPKTTGGGGGGGGSEQGGPTAGESKKISKYEAGLRLIDRQEKAINEKYDKRIKALDAVAKANAEISQQQKDQLDLADALSRGDIAAAARAAQTMRANEAQANIDREKDAMERSRQAEINNIKDPLGRTKATLTALIDAIQAKSDRRDFDRLNKSSGGMIPKYFANGGSPLGTDVVPAMLTPGEFVVKKSAVGNFGAKNLKSINDGTYSGESVYNYSINVNVNSNASADAIARTVMTQIKGIDSQRLRGNKF
jgi:TP901 family phage tail tape measure protein